MNYLIFDSQAGGHHLEYCHHLYGLAALHKEDKFFFLVTPRMKDVMSTFEWQVTPNVEFIYLTELELEKCSKKKLLLAAWHKSMIIRKYVKQLNIDHVWLIMLMLTMPFLPYFLPKGVKMTGVLYRIFLYEEAKMSWLRRNLENIRFRILAHNKHIGKVLVLNDQYMTDELNERYHTDHFLFLPDPIPNIDIKRVKNLRDELGAKSNDKVYLQFGGLTRRKGTMEVLKAIELMTTEQLKDKIFVFAGKVYSDIREEFYQRVEAQKDKVRVVVYDEFCTYNHLFSLCNSCDVVMIPYTNTTQSSGVIGYAAFFDKPVIGPQGGLLGRLIKSYKLGICLDEPTSEYISKSLDSRIYFESANYAKSHSVEKFINRFINNEL